MQDGEQEEVKKPEVKKLDRYSVSDTTPPTETLVSDYEKDVLSNISVFY